MSDSKKKKKHEERYQLQESVGEGANGTVYKALDRETGESVAVKVINLEESTEELEEIHKELAALIGVNHRHLVKYLNSFIKGSELNIVMEYMEGGSLGNLLQEVEGVGFDEATIAWIMKDMCEALSYLHERRLLHRDIKASNVLVSSNGDVKLADFGASASLADSIPKRRTLTGTPFWMAPEVIKQDEYDFKADIWSLGITAIELAKKEPPLASVHPMKVLFLIPENPSPRLDESFSQDFQDFVNACLQKDPADRPTVAELLRNSQFLRGARKTPLLQELARDRLSEEASVVSEIPTPRVVEMSTPKTSHVGADAEEAWSFSPTHSPSKGVNGRRTSCPSRARRKNRMGRGPIKFTEHGGSTASSSAVSDSTVKSRHYPSRGDIVEAEEKSPDVFETKHSSPAVLFDQKDVNWLTDVYMPCVEAVAQQDPDNEEQKDQVEDASKMLELAGILMDGAAADGRILRSFLVNVFEKMEEIASRNDCDR